MFDKIKKISDKASLVIAILFLISLLIDSWKLSGILLFFFVIAVNTSTYMEIQRQNNPIQGMTDIMANVFKGQE